MIKQLVFLIMSVFLISILSAECIDYTDITMNESSLILTNNMKSADTNWYISWDMNYVSDINKIDITYWGDTGGEWIKSEDWNLTEGEHFIFIEIDRSGQYTHYLRMYNNYTEINQIQIPQQPNSLVSVTLSNSLIHSNFKLCSEKPIYELVEEIIEEPIIEEINETEIPDEPKPKRRSSGGGSSKKIEPIVIEIEEPKIEVEPIEVTERKLELERIKQELEELDRNIFVKFWEWLKSIFT